MALLCAMVGLILGRWQGEYAPLVRIGGLILLGAFLVGNLQRSLDALFSLLGGEGVLPYARVMLRALGIGLLVRLCGEVLRGGADGEGLDPCALPSLDPGYFGACGTYFANGGHVTCRSVTGERK